MKKTAWFENSCVATPASTALLPSVGGS